jgi:hypothetical protein
MRFLTTILLLGLVVGFGCTDNPLEMPELVAEYTIEAPSFSVAKNYRDIHAPGSPIRLTCNVVEETCSWSFISPVAVQIPVLAGGDCEYLPEIPGQPGVTACDDYTEAKEQRDAMVDDGFYNVSKICHDEDAGWYFRWCFEGEEESSCNTNGEGCENDEPHN